MWHWAGMPHKGDSEEVPAQSSSHLAKTKPCRQLSLASHTASQEPLDRPHVVLHMGIASHSAFRERERERAHLQEPLWMPAPDPGTKACLEGRQCWRTKGGLNPAPHPPHPPESFRVLQHSSNLLGCLRHNKVGDSSGLRGLEVRSSKPRSASGSCGHRSNVLSPLADAEFATVTLVPYSGPPRSDPIRCCRSVLQPG